MRDAAYETAISVTHSIPYATGRMARAGLTAALLLGLAACGPGGTGSSRGGPTNPGLLPGASESATIGSPADNPEGAPAGSQRLSLQSLGTGRLGDTTLSAPPPDALRQVEGVPVAILVPLTGRFAAPGQALLEGAQMALFDVGNAEVRLMPFDTQSTALGAEQAAREAVRQGARLIIGPLLADSVRAIRPIVEAARIKAIAFSNSSNVAGDPIYLAGFTPEEQVEAIVLHAMAEGRRRFAVIAPSNDYGNVAVDALREAATRHGGEFARVAFYDPETLDFEAQVKSISDYDERVRALQQQRAELSGRTDQASTQALQRLANLRTYGDPPFDALLIPALDQQSLQILSAQLAYFDVDAPAVRLLGMERWDGFSGLSNEPGLIGSQYPAARSVYRSRFEARFSDLFGHAPSALSALAYDVTAVAAALAGDARTGPRYDAETLTSEDGFIGAQGLFRFTDEGVAQQTFSILEIAQTGRVLVREAPNNFDQPVLPQLPPAPPVDGTDGQPTS